VLNQQMLILISTTLGFLDHSWYHHYHSGWHLRPKQNENEGIMRDGFIAVLGASLASKGLLELVFYTLLRCLRGWFKLFRRSIAVHRMQQFL